MSSKYSLLSAYLPNISHPHTWNQGEYHRHQVFCMVFVLTFDFFSSPEHEVLMVSYCYRSLSVVRASCVNFWLVNTLEATVLVQSTSNLLRMIILTKSRLSSNMGHVGSKTRSVGQIMEKPCEHSRGLSFGPKFIKLSRDWILIIPGQKLGQ